MWENDLEFSMDVKMTVNDSVSLTGAPMLVKL